MQLFQTTLTPSATLTPYTFCKVLLTFLSLTLMACQSEDVGQVNTLLDDTTRFEMSPPMALLRAVDPEALELEVTVNGNVVDTTEDAATNTRVGTITLTAGTLTDIQIIWMEDFEGIDLELGRASRMVNIGSAPTQQIFFTENDFDFSADDDQDNRSNLEERENDTDPLDDASPGILPEQIEVIVRLQIIDERILINADLSQNLTLVATLNNEPVQLNRNGTGDVWIGTATASEDSSAFLSVEVFQNPDRSILLGTASRNQDVGSGTEFNIGSTDYATVGLDEDGDGLSNLEEIIQGFNPLDSNSPMQDPCNTSQFALGCDIDTDLDGEPDSIETEGADTDDDGIPNFQESDEVDADGDGRNAERDIDESDPCIPSENNIACQNILE